MQRLVPNLVILAVALAGCASHERDPSEMDEMDAGGDALAALCAGELGEGTNVGFVVPEDRVRPNAVESWHGAACGDASCCANAVYTVVIDCPDGSEVQLTRAAGVEPLCSGPVNEFSGDITDPPLPECLELATCAVANATVSGTVRADGSFLVEAF